MLRWCSVQYRRACTNWIAFSLALDSAGRSPNVVPARRYTGSALIRCFTFSCQRRALLAYRRAKSYVAPVQVGMPGLLRWICPGTEPDMRVNCSLCCCVDSRYVVGHNNLVQAVVKQALRTAAHFMPSLGVNTHYDAESLKTDYPCSEDGPRSVASCCSGQRQERQVDVGSSTGGCR